MLNFIDLFAGLSGIRIGFENAARELGVQTKCLLTAEIKPAAIEALKHRYPDEKVDYNIYDVKAQMFNDSLDIVLGGFPCQPFSAAGNRLGFLDTRGTLFFEIERIIHESTALGHKPKGFILENVEGLVKHGGVEDGATYGRTLTTIVKKLKLAGYNVYVKVLDASDFGVPQARKRVYIVGVDKKIGKINFDNLPTSHTTIANVREYGLPVEHSAFTKKLLAAYTPNQLEGKYIKDKRGGEHNIHSWDISLKGKATKQEKEFLNLLLKERRKKKWAELIGIDWMDGMPLTQEQIASFYKEKNLTSMLASLTEKGYLVFEHPKKKIIISRNGNTASRREPDTTKPKGYNIVTGKLSFEFSQFLDSNSIAPTMVAMDMERIGVVEEDGVRHLTIDEGLRLFGYEDYDLSYLNNKKKGRAIAFDLLGNSVCVPVIQVLAERLISAIKKKQK